MIVEKLKKIHLVIEKAQREGLETLNCFDKGTLLYSDRFKKLKCEESAKLKCNCLATNLEFYHKTEVNKEGLCILCGHYPIEGKE